MRKVVVMGGGPAGMLAAWQAARSGARVLLLERNERLGKKLVITGKGRCNVTNDTDTAGLVSNVPGNGRFLYSAFAAFSSQDLQQFLESRGVALKRERGNRVFPLSDRSFDVVDALRGALAAEGVEVRLNSRVEAVREAKGQIIAVAVNGKDIATDALVIATGGLSYPSTGSTGDGYALARALGHTIISPRPALVPLETMEAWPKTLTGLTLKNVSLSIWRGDRRLGEEFGEMLFTHFGVSGPIVLSLSRIVTDAGIGEGAWQARINLKPALTEEQLDNRMQRDLLKYQRKEMKNALVDLLPKSMISVVLAAAQITEEEKVHQLTREKRKALVETLQALPLTIRGPRPLAEAIVTAGGISTREINSQTLASKLVSGLYFAGEVIDIDGFTGGFNLQAAFSTGFLAGRSAAKDI